jgi:hypothetical protein
MLVGISEARKALRLTTTAFDTEIKGLINACKKDLELAGVVNFPDGDPLIKRTVLTYVKANFGQEDGNDRFKRHYNSLKLQLREAREYREQF